MGLVVHMLNMFNRDWSECIGQVDVTGGSGWMTTEGGYNLVMFGDAALVSQNSFLDSPARDEMFDRGGADPEYPLGHGLYYPHHCISLMAGGSFEIDLVLESDLPTGIYDGPEGLPRHFVLYPNYPNPFNGATTVRYGMPESGVVSMAVYDGRGRIVMRPMQESRLRAGSHETELDFDLLPSGIYILEITVEYRERPDSRGFRRLTLVK